MPLLCFLISMKRFLILLLLVPYILPLSLNRGKFEVCGPLNISIGEYTYIKDSSAVFEFKFFNSGDSLLTISKVIPSCPCMKAIWPTEPLPPRDTGIIVVHYFADHPGHFRKTLTVVNDGDPAWSYISVEGTAVEESEDQ